MDYCFNGEEKKCPYLPNLKSTTKYCIIEECQIVQAEEFTIKGWRRFGKLFFRPICNNCQRCQSLRVKVDDFYVSKSFKRIINKNKDTVIKIKRPTFTLEHLLLYKKYHKKMSDKRGWENEEVTFSTYHASFVNGHGDFGYELNFLRDNKLIGISFIDIMPKALSSIYCFYDHDYERYSIGTLSILKQIELAKSLKIPYLYLGYYIKGNKSLEYKTRFKPFEFFQSQG